MKRCLGLLLLPVLALPQLNAQAVDAKQPFTGKWNSTVDYFTSQIYQTIGLTQQGNTIHNTTVEAVGAGGKGVKRVLGGKPETGPFYVESAMPGDTLVVHIIKLRLNRDYAVSDDAIVGRALDDRLAAKMKDNGKDS